jgi:F0F1-type ATP synthase delta subunit
MYNSSKYAKSLFDVSVKVNNTLSVKKELQLIAYLFKKTSTFRLIFITKKIDLNKKVDIINSALSMLSP